MNSVERPGRPFNTPEGPTRGDFPLLPKQPVKYVGLDPLYGGDLNSSYPPPIKGTYFSSIIYNDSEVQEPIRFVRWNSAMPLSFSSMVLSGFFLGGGYGLMAGVTRCAANWGIALLGIPFYPFIVNSKTEPSIFPSPKQYWDYARYRFDEKFGLNAIWNRFTRKTINPIIPMSSATQRRLLAEKEAKAKQWLQFHILPKKTVEELPNKFPPYPQLRYLSPEWYVTRKMSHIWVGLRNWYNNHPLVQESHYYRIQNRLSPSQFIPIKQRFQMFGRYYLSNLYPFAHTIYHLYTFRYATQHARDMTRYGPFAMLLVTSTFYSTASLVGILPIDERVSLVAGTVAAYRANQWFWHGEQFLPTLRRPQLKDVPKFAFFCACAWSISSLLIRVMDAGGRSNLKGPQEHPLLKHQMRQYTDPKVNYWEIPLLTHRNNLANYWERIQAERREIRAKKQEAYDGVWNKEHVFPGEGWDPLYLTIDDGEKKRRVKMSSKEWRDWEMYAPAFGNLVNYEEYERKVQEAREEHEKLTQKPLEMDLPPVDEQLLVSQDSRN